MKISGLDQEGKNASWLAAIDDMLAKITEHSTRTKQLLSDLEVEHYLATGNDTDLIELIERDDAYAQAQFQALQSYIKSTRFGEDVEEILATPDSNCNP